MAAGGAAYQGGAALAEVERLEYLVASDDLLDRNELFLLTVDLSGTAISIGPYHQFTLEVKPPGGPVLPIERSVPGRVSQYVNLH